MTKISAAAKGLLLTSHRAAFSDSFNRQTSEVDGVSSSTYDYYFGQLAVKMMPSAYCMSMDKHVVDTALCTFVKPFSVI